MDSNQINHNINHNIIRTPIRYIPYPHSVYQNVFPNDIYQEMINNLPDTKDYTFSNKSYPERGFIFIGSNQSFQKEHSDTYRALVRSYNQNDSLQKDFNQNAVWKGVTNWLLSDQTLDLWLKRYWPYIEDRFDEKVLKDMKFYQRTTLCRDFSGYAIPPHTDTPRKIITILFYLAKDNDNSQFGTEILSDNRKRNNQDKSWDKSWDSKHQESWDDFEIHTSAPYQQNSAMDFFVGPESWHGVKTFLGTGGTVRDTIQVAIYGYNYKEGEPTLG